MDVILTYLNSGLTGIFSFIVLLGVLVFVHELGHFLVARWSGVRVEVFSLGFGKKIFQYKKGDTNYCISLIPLGGYVKMFGELPLANEVTSNGEEFRSFTEEEKKVSFTHKPVGKRIAIVLGGPLMNLFFAIVVYFAVSLLGEPAQSPIIGDIDRGSPAEQMGFLPGDKIVYVDSKPIRSWDHFQKFLVSSEKENAVVAVQNCTTCEIRSIDTKLIQKESTNPLSSKKLVYQIEGVNPYSRSSHIGLTLNSPLRKLGLQPGDRIASINGQKVTHFREIEPLIKNQVGRSLSFEIERSNIKTPETTEKMTLDYQETSAKGFSLNQLGIESTDLYLAKVFKKTPADQAGFKEGDRLLSINNQPINTWDEVLKQIKSYSGTGTIKIKVARNQEIMDFEVTPQMTSQMNMSTGTEDKRFTIGISPLIYYSAPEVVILKSANMLEAFTASLTRSWDITVMTLLSFKKLVAGEISSKNIGGVISIAQAAHDTFQAGLATFLNMMALISINLFIFNLLPVPVLDGGHLVFYVIEAIKGSPLGLKKVEYAQQVGFVLLMSLMVFALFNDVTRLLQ